MYSFSFTPVTCFIGVFDEIPWDKNPQLSFHNDLVVESLLRDYSLMTWKSFQSTK